MSASPAGANQAYVDRFVGGETECGTGEADRGKFRGGGFWRFATIHDLFSS